MFNFLTSTEMTVSENASQICSVEQMRWILERERARAERTRRAYSLVVMTFTHELGESDLEVLSNLLVQRLRLTDEAGLLDNKRVAILLSDTSEGGAWKVARDLTSQFDAGQAPDCDVYVYPATPVPFGEPGGRLDTGAPILDRPAPDASRFYTRSLPKWKRAIDLLLGSFVLIAATPILAIAAIAIKATSSGPVLFKQQRAGLGGCPFTILKLRTMSQDAEAQKAALRASSEQDGPAFKMKNDPRVTSVGRFLRKSCIDELPQLCNVLRGDMTLVGPRPLPCDEADRCQPWEQRRLTVTPGLTCTWQAGARRVTFAEWMRMDLRYIRERSLKKDVRLLWATFLKVIRNKASH